MAGSIAELVRVLPPDWPNEPREVKPSDLTRFAPAGLGLGAPMVMMPWDDLESVFQRPNYYGLQRPTGHPFRDAPMNDSTGGVVYFDDGVTPADLEALLRVLSVHTRAQEYVVFLAEAENVMRDRYLTQMRLITHFGLRGLFGVPAAEDGQPFPPQPLTLGQLLAKFIEVEQARWSDRWTLDGCLGGDGDWAKETLGFGLMVENGYQGVYRIWSRPWLVTK